ncbi:RIP metalloprotease RseP [Candidatus Peregrinibacteria bacterium]|nr:RIP metalloprotease RseP [Candidatus Peregrinibacteria bacterium]
MNYIITGLAFFIVFSLLILIHEFGHYIAARRSGIKVEEFGFGMPPRIWGKKKGETTYTINWIPIGGFVRLYGEDSTDKKSLTAKRSYMAQPMRTRIKVIVAGVVMNFFLAWLLISIGFMFGMQPILAPDDVLPAISNGTLVLEEGLRIKNVEEGSIADEVGLKADDLIYSVDNRVLTNENFSEEYFQQIQRFSVVRDDSCLIYEFTDEQVLRLENGENAGLEFYNYAFFPRVRIFDIAKDTEKYQAGVRSGDVIIRVNGKEVFGIEEYEEIIRGKSTLDYLIYRDGSRERILVEVPQTNEVIISQIAHDSPAERVGLRPDDIIISVNGYMVENVESMTAFIKENMNNEEIALLIERDGERIFVQVAPEEGQLGVYLSELINYENLRGITFYNINQISSVKEIKDEKYPIYLAPYKAVGEIYRLSKITATMFGDFLTGFLRTGQVSENIAGPLGIIQLTHVFVHEGLMSLLRFMAILSLSLGVINILPIPALDGGRLLFIFIEWLSGRKVNQQLEAVAHVTGYVLILLLIVLVTYGDIVRFLGMGG